MSNSKSDIISLVMESTETSTLNWSPFTHYADNSVINSYYLILAGVEVFILVNLLPLSHPLFVINIFIVRAEFIEIAFRSDF